MSLEQEIEAIRAGIKAGRFSNEASVSQGIVLRLLHALGWSTYDTDSVWPEYSLKGRRVDFALCSPPKKPIAFIEVKQLGQSDGAEKQLFEYAFHIGVPLAILTDGREWNFFLPGEQGDYGERRVYKLDIVERNIEECVVRLERYLLHASVVSGAAIQSAREDYRNVSKDRQMLDALPKAWMEIIKDEDEMLLEIVADRVESLCGYKPNPDMVANFLKGYIVDPTQHKGERARISLNLSVPKVAPLPTNLPTPNKWLAPNPLSPEPPSVSKGGKDVASSGSTGFSFEGRFYPTRNAIDTLKQVFDLFIQRDSSFGERFSRLPKHGRSRRYLAANVNDLYPGRPDLVQECSTQLPSGWWIGTNHSKQTISQIIGMACDVAQVSYGTDLKVNLG